MRTVLLSTAFQLGVFCSLGLCQTSAKPGQWKEYVYPSAGFAVTLPSDPKPHDDYEHSGITTYTVHMTPQLGLTLRVTKYKKDCASTLNEIREKARRGDDPNLIPGSFKDVTVKGYPGLEWQSAPPTTPFTQYDREICVDGQFYMFTARWLKGLPKPESVQRIVNSLRSLSQPK